MEKNLPSQIIRPLPHPIRVFSRLRAHLGGSAALSLKRVRFLRLENHDFSRFFFCVQLYWFEDTKRNAFGSHRFPRPSPLLKVSNGVGDKFILTDLVIIYNRFGSSQPPISLEIKTSAIIPKKLMKKELTYSSNTF